MRAGWTGDQQLDASPGRAYPGRGLDGPFEILSLGDADRSQHHDIAAHQPDARRQLAGTSADLEQRRGVDAVGDDMG